MNSSWILLELLLGGIGFILFTYGRKQERVPHLVTGVLFLVYPFFIASSVWLLLSAVLLLGLLWWTVGLGW